MCSDVRPTACNFLIGVFGFRYTGTKFSVSFVLLFCLRKRDYLVGGKTQGGRALLEMSKIFHKFCPNFLNIPEPPGLFRKFGTFARFFDGLDHDKRTNTFSRFLKVWITNSEQTPFRDFFWRVLFVQRRQLQREEEVWQLWHAMDEGSGDGTLCCFILLCSLRR